MKKIVALLSLALLSFAACANPDTVDLKYRGFSFSVPAGAEAIGSNGGIDNFLVLRYGKENGKKYLAFTDMTDDKLIEYGCAPAEFLRAAFDDIKASPCNEAELKSFKKVFLEGSEATTWKGEKMVAYYVNQPKGQFIFLVSSENKAIKIDSDFLSKSKFKAVVQSSVK